MQTLTSDRTSFGLASGWSARRLAESLPHIVWVTGPDGATEYLNARGAAFLGLVPEDTNGWSWLDALHPDDVDVERMTWERAVRERSSFDADLRIRDAVGDYRWVASRGSPVFAPDGTLESWVGTWTDIDDVKRREEELRQSERLASDAASLLDTLQSKAPVGFLFVDREFRYVRINEKLAAMNGPSVEEHLGRTVAEVVPDLWPHLEPLYRSVLDTGEPVLDLEVSGETAATGGDERHWLANMYPVHGATEIIGVGVVVVDVTERVEAERVLSALTEAAVGAVAAAVEARDPYTAGHQRRVADLAAAIATELGLDTDTIEGIRVAAAMHDIGKIGVPAEILSKPGRISAAEFALVKEHPQTGHDIMQGIEFPWPIAEMILQHHERMDGSGYPRGLAGAEVSLGARIIAVADVVEAMSSHRPYRPSRGFDDALNQIAHDRGTLLDADAVDACIRLFRDERFSFGGR